MHLKHLCGSKLLNRFSDFQAPGWVPLQPFAAEQVFPFKAWPVELSACSRPHEPIQNLLKCGSCEYVLLLGLVVMVFARAAFR